MQRKIGGNKKKASMRMLFYVLMGQTLALMGSGFFVNASWKEITFPALREG